MLEQPSYRQLNFHNNSAAFDVRQGETGWPIRLRSDGTLRMCVHVPYNNGKDGLPENVEYLPTVCYMNLPESVGYPLRLSWHPKFGLL